MQLKIELHKKFNFFLGLRPNPSGLNYELNHLISSSPHRISSDDSFNELKTLLTNVKLRHEILLITGQKPLFAESTHLYECVDVVHESLSPANNELIHTRYGMRPTERV